MKALALLLTLCLCWLPRAQAEEVRVAVVGPYAGDYRVFGDQLWRGASKAAAELNAFGGIAGERLVLVRALDACGTDAEAVEVVANQLVEEQEVHAVLGIFARSALSPPPGSTTRPGC